MADLGTIGTLAGSYQNSDSVPNGRSVLRGIVVSDVRMVHGGKDDVEGSLAPSLRMDARGTFKFVWVIAEDRELYVDVKQAANVSPRPRVTIKANPEIGIASDIQASAGSGTGWVTIGPLLVEPTSEGPLEVLLENLYDAQYRGAPCYWDNITESEPTP